MPTITGFETFKFPDSFEEQLRTLATQMIEDGKDLIKIPDTPGMVLVRADSKEHTSRKGKKETTVAPFQHQDVNFVVCLE